MGSHKIKKIRHLKTQTGNNYSLTISKEAQQKFSGCTFIETILDEGILFTSGTGLIIEKKLWY